MIDFHCHLDLYQDAQSLLPIVAERNIFTLVVTTSPKAWQATSKKFAGYENIEVAVGLHPEIADKKINERELLISCISNAKFVGEVGIDGSQRYQKTIPLQESIFNDVLIECEKVGGKVISIHSRNATTRVLNLIQKNCQNSKPVLHWFSGSVKEVHRAVDLGCWFSVGPTMLSSSKGQTILRELPLERVLPETDGPFAKNGSIPLMPWEAINISDQLALIWPMSKDKIYEQMKFNLLELMNNK
jgi:TatD DNase family protein